MIRQYFKWGLQTAEVWNRGHAYPKEFVDKKYSSAGITCSDPQIGSDTKNLYVSYLEGGDDDQVILDHIIQELGGINLDNFEALKEWRDIIPDGTNFTKPDGSTGTWGFAYYDSTSGVVVQDETNVTDPHVVYEGYPVLTASDIDKLTAKKIGDQVVIDTYGIDGTLDQLKQLREMVIALGRKDSHFTDTEMTIADADTILSNFGSTHNSIKTIISNGDTAKTSL